MCRKCFAHTTRALMFVISKMPEEEQILCVEFVHTMMNDFIELGFDFEALDQKIADEITLLKLKAASNVTH